MARSESNGSPVALFPFLAVLMCTQGALILLLVVISRQIRVNTLEDLRTERAAALAAEAANDGSGMAPAPSDESPPTAETPEGNLWPLPPLPADLPPPAVAENVTPAPPAPDLQPGPEPGPEAGPAQAASLGKDVDAAIAEAEARAEAEAQAAANAQAEAEAAAAAALHERNTRQAALDRDWSDRVARLRSEVAEAAASLTSERAAADALQQQLDALDSQSNRLATTEADLLARKQRVDAAEDDLSAQRRQVTSRLAELEAQLEAVRERHAAAKSRYALIAYDGRQGTIAQPIVIECTMSRLSLPCEQVDLTADQLVGFTPEYNPLKSAVAALVELRRRRPGSTSSDERPYVLYVVRPGGAEAYYTARKMLEDLDTATGYELIPEEYDLEWPTATPEARDVCRQAMTRALEARRPGSGLAGRGLGTAHEGLLPPDETGRFRLAEAEELRRGSHRTVHFGGQDVERGAAGDFRRPASPGGGSQRNGAPGTGGEPREFGLFPSPAAEGASDDPRELADRHEASRSAGPSARRSAEPLLPDEQDNSTESARTIPEEFLAPGRRRTPTEGQPAQAPGLRPLPTNPRDFVSSGPGGQGGPAPASASARRGQAAQRGEFTPPRRWGVDNPLANIGYERDVVIDVFADRLELSDDVSAPVDRRASREDIQELLATVIDAEVRTFGAPPANFYWSPRVILRIHPGGQQHRQRLADLTNSWGLRTTVDSVLE